MLTDKQTYFENRHHQIKIYQKNNLNQKNEEFFYFQFIFVSKI